MVPIDPSYDPLVPLSYPKGAINQPEKVGTKKQSTAFIEDPHSEQQLTIPEPQCVMHVSKDLIVDEKASTKQQSATAIKEIKKSKRKKQEKKQYATVERVSTAPEQTNEAPLTAQQTTIPGHMKTLQGVNYVSKGFNAADQPKKADTKQESSTGNEAHPAGQHLMIPEHIKKPQGVRSVPKGLIAAVTAGTKNKVLLLP